MNDTEKIELLRLAGKAMLAAIDELLTEFVSTKRAANWGIIHDAVAQMGRALRETI